MTVPPSPTSAASAFVIRPLATDDEACVCAEIMSSTEPWLTFGRSFQQSLEILRDPRVVAGYLGGSDVAVHRSGKGGGRTRKRPVKAGGA